MPSGSTNYSKTNGERRVVDNASTFIIGDGSDLKVAKVENTASAIGTTENGKLSIDEYVGHNLENVDKLKTAGGSVGVSTSGITSIGVNYSDKKQEGITKNTVIGNVRIEHLHSVSSNGVRTADVSVFDQNTNQWKLKVKSDGITPQETTLFPEYWSKSRIIVEVDIAYENKIISQTRHNIWEGITPSGIKVEGYIAPNTTVYPLP